MIDQGSSITAEEKQYAQEAGFLIPDRDMTHDEIISWARQWHSNTPLLQASNAFLASISSRRLEFRSALGSYAVGQHLISHQFDEDRSAALQATVVGTIEVMPNCAATCDRRMKSSTEAPTVSIPIMPCTCTSTNPGASILPVKS